MLTVYIDELDLTSLEYYRAALSEVTFDGRKKAISDFSKQMELWQLKGLTNSVLWRSQVLSTSPEFLRQMASETPVGSEGAVAFSQCVSRFNSGQGRKLRIAEQIGLEIWKSIEAGKFRGLHSKTGILDTVSHKARKLGFPGARDLNVLRKIWMTYRGVVHLGVARTFCKEKGLDNTSLLEVAEGIRRLLSTQCPKGTKTSYVDEDDQISFVYKSTT